MTHALIRGFWLVLIRLFYRDIGVTGHPPDAGPVILVANHPNGLLDPLVLQVALGRPVAFLSKSTLFSNPVSRVILRAFNAVPVYRAKEADTAQNAETFAHCRRLLQAGGWLALFPEGISHDAPGLQPLKTGAARIALDSARMASGGTKLTVVPVGILYEEKEIFRSRVAISFGAPVPVPLPTRDEPSVDEVRALTDAIADALGEVVLQAEDHEVWRGLVAVAAWTRPDRGRDVAALDQRARRLGAAYRVLAVRDPARIAALVATTRRFARVLRSVGIADPFSVESPQISLLAALLPLLLLAPVALLGALLGWLPYRLIRSIAVHLARGSVDVVSTFKLLIGTVLLTTTWVGEALVAGAWLGPLAGLGMLALAPLSGLVALRWGERLDLRREALRASWLATNRGQITRMVAERRQALADAVEAALGSADPTP